MSLLASDLPANPTEREIVQSAMSGPPAAETTPPPAEPSISEAFAAEIAAAPSPTAAPETAAEKSIAALDAQDPRFAQDTPRARMLEGLDDEASPVRAFGNMTTPLRKIVEDAETRSEPDRQETAAVPVAPEEPQANNRAASGTARMISAANIRSRPKKGAKVIGTVPGGTQVELVSCDGWCEIIAGGKRGFVWGEFVRRGQAAAKPVAVKVNSRKPKVLPAATAPQSDVARGR